MAITRTKNHGIRDAKSPTTKVVRIEDVVDILEVPPTGDFVRVRPVGDISSVAYHWITIITEKKGEVSIPKQCLAWDADTDSLDSTKHCPYCKLPNQRLQVQHLSNVIDRDLQENTTPRKPTAEEVESGYKSKGTKTSPVRVMKIVPSLLGKLQSVADLNRHKDRKTGVTTSHDLADERYGMDVFISYDKSKKGTDMYNAQKDEKTPLTEEELEYYIYKLDGVLLPDGLEEAKAEAKKFAKMSPDASEEEDEEDDEGVDEDDDVDDYDMDEEEEPAPRRKAPVKTAAKPAKKAVVDDFDEDEEEEPAPRRKAPAKAPVKATKKVVDDFDDDEEEEEEPAPRRKAPVKAVAKPVRKAVVDDFDDDEEEEEEEEPAPRRKAPVKAAKKVVDDFDDDEEEEEEEPAPRRKAPAKAAPAARRSAKPVDDDDDLDDLDDEPPVPRKTTRTR